MEDIGFNGTGSRFNSRFESGSPIQAKQLNDLAAGIQVALPMPYLGEGPTVSFTPGGSLITYNQPPQVQQDIPAWKPTVKDDSVVVYPGTVNSQTPTIDGTPITDSPAPALALVYSDGTSGYSFVYLDCKVSGYNYPNSPSIIASGTQLTATDADGYLLLFTVYKDATTSAITVWHYVKSSLWTDRIKIGSATAKYYFGAV